MTALVDEFRELISIHRRWRCNAGKKRIEKEAQKD
jgi:hypothetical protein